MSRLIASLLLSVLLFPVGAILYLVVFVTCSEIELLRGRHEATAFLIAGVVTWAFAGWYWLAVWRKTVTWTGPRVATTRYAAAAAVALGLLAGAAAGTVDTGFGYFIASVVPPLLWMVATVLVWRETDAERSARLRARGLGGDGPTIPCPTCGYDMTGLKGTRCPECGSEFTVDELIAALPGKAAAELER